MLERPHRHPRAAAARGQAAPQAQPAVPRQQGAPAASVQALPTTGMGGIAAAGVAAAATAAALQVTVGRLREPDDLDD